jgi:hypothetical protein
VNRGRLLLLFGYAVSLLAQPAFAQRSVSYAGSARDAGDSSVAMVDLRFGRNEIDVDFTDDDAVHVLENGFLLVDILGEFAPHTRGGGRLGWVSTSADDRAASQGVNPSGSLLGLVIDGHYPLAGENIFLLAAGHAQWADTYSSNGDNSTNYTWWSLSARLGAALKIKRVELRGGATYRDVDGKERTRGDINRTTSFESDRRDSVFFELDYNTDPGGHIGFALESGGTEAWYFYFRRFF